MAPRLRAPPGHGGGNRKICFWDADLSQLHPASYGNRRDGTGSDGEHSDQSDREPVGNDDRVDGKIKIEPFVFSYCGKNR
jgi:hypothetical protein